MADPRRRAETLRSKLRDGRRGGSDVDRKALLEFSDRLDLLNSKYTDHRYLKLLRHCTRMSEGTDASIAGAIVFLPAE